MIRHAFSLGVKLSRAGWPACFYEDVPYALELEPGATEARLSALKASGLDLHPIVAIDVTGAWKMKMRSILTYGSQRSVSFDSHVGRGDPRGRIDEVMRAYALRVGNGALCERFWSLA